MSGPAVPIVPESAIALLVVGAAAEAEATPKTKTEAETRTSLRDGSHSMLVRRRHFGGFWLGRTGRPRPDLVLHTLEVLEPSVVLLKRVLAGPIDGCLEHLQALGE